MSNQKIKLDKPLSLKDEKLLEEVEVREPETGELKGINILQLHLMNVDEYKKLLPRITHPRLSPAQINQLKLSDVQKFMNTVIGFLAGIDDEDDYTT